VEEGVEQEDGFGLDGCGVEEHGLAALVVEAVAVERGLDHDERVGDVFVVENVAVEGGFVGRVVENLQELRAAEVEHELWVEGEVLFESGIVSYCEEHRSWILTYLKEDGSSFLYSAKREHRRISMRSTHRRTSGPSSTSALNTAMRDMRTAAAS